MAYKRSYPFASTDVRDINDIEIPSDFPNHVQFFEPAMQISKMRHRLSISSNDAPTPLRLSQVDCPLFKLPQELRDEIYVLVLGGQTIHLAPTNYPKILNRNGVDVARRRTYARHRCPHPLPRSWNWSLLSPSTEREGRDMGALCVCCYGGAERLGGTQSCISTSIRLYSWSHSDGNKEEYYALLNLPLTCSRVYSETIDLIYRQNKFHVSAKLLDDSATRLAPYIPTQRLANIRSLSFSVTWNSFLMLKDRHGRYKSFWLDIQSCFAGLREIEACYFFMEKIILNQIDLEDEPPYFEKTWIVPNRSTFIDPLKPLANQVQRFKLWIMLPDWMLDSWREGAPKSIEIEGGHWPVREGRYEHFHWE